MASEKNPQDTLQGIGISSAPQDWLLEEAQALPYNPFLTYPEVPDIARTKHVPGTPWLTEEDALKQIGFKPDAIFCYTGSIKQPWIDKEGKLHAPLEGDKELDQEGAHEPPDEAIRSENLRSNFPYGAASFAKGEDPYRKDIQGTGGKVNVIATKHLCELDKNAVVFTMASYDNEIERRLALEKGMPTAATIYEHELRRRNVENPIIKVDQEEVKTTFGMVVATLRSISENPNLKSAVIITQRYNIPRAEAFFDVCGWNQNRLIQEWIFNNYKIKTGENLLTDEYRKIVSDLHERGVEIKIIGAEDIMDQVDNNKIQSGAQPRYGAVLRLVYPPKLSRQQFESMNPEEQRNWIDCIKNLRVRLETEERGVRQIKNQTYWAP